jgi:hypothetical protein
LLLAFTCSSSDPTSACPTPVAGSQEEAILAKTRAGASFPVLYPCFLPGAQGLRGGTVSGEPGRQQAELVFGGPFDMTIRQSQVPPPAVADPAGTSRTLIDLFPNVPATFVQRNDGTPDALYHLYWTRNGIFYELQAFGPAQQQRPILQVARSLQ